MWVVYGYSTSRIWGESRGLDHCACLTGSDRKWPCPEVTWLFPSISFPVLFFQYFFFRYFFSRCFFVLFSRIFPPVLFFPYFFYPSIFSPYFFPRTIYARSEGTKNEFILPKRGLKCFIAPTNHITGNWTNHKLLFPAH
jgi:hypothetical protein